MQCVKYTEAWSTDWTLVWAVEESVMQQKAGSMSNQRITLHLPKPNTPHPLTSLHWLLCKGIHWTYRPNLQHAQVASLQPITSLQQVTSSWIDITVLQQVTHKLHPSICNSEVTSFQHVTSTVTDITFLQQVTHKLYPSTCRTQQVTFLQHVTATVTDITFLQHVAHKLRSSVCNTRTCIPATCYTSYILQSVTHKLNPSNNPLRLWHTSYIPSTCSTQATFLQPVAHKLHPFSL